MTFKESPEEIFVKERRRKEIERRKTIALVILIAIGLCALIYIGQQRYRQQDNQENLGFYQLGIQDTMKQIFQRTINCEKVPIVFPIFNNQTNQTQDVKVTLIAEECLRSGE